METRYLAERVDYDGSQLRAHWILRTTGIAGDAAVAFQGACAVTDAEMADLEDLLDGPGIAGDDMLHLLVEIFDDGDLLRAICLQRLVSAIAGDTLRTLVAGGLQELRRVGDDLYLGQGKLSISIATRSLVSSLIHFAVNVRNAGAPVETAALEDLGVEPKAFGEALLSAVQMELASIRAARVKVRSKGEA